MRTPSSESVPSIANHSSRMSSATFRAPSSDVLGLVMLWRSSGWCPALVHRLRHRHTVTAGIVRSAFRAASGQRPAASGQRPAASGQRRNLLRTIVTLWLEYHHVLHRGRAFGAVPGAVRVRPRVAKLLRIDLTRLTPLGLRPTVWGALVTVAVGTATMVVNARRHRGPEPSAYGPERESSEVDAATTPDQGDHRVWLRRRTTPHRQMDEVATSHQIGAKCG